MTPALARIKRALREAIGGCGGIDGAAATVNRRRSVVGDWNNLNVEAWPALDCALALDEVAVARGQLPPITARLARELGGMFVPHIDTGAEEGTANAKVLELAEHLGRLSGEIAKALANDGIIDSDEAACALVPLEGLAVCASQLTALLERVRAANIPARVR